MHGLLARLELSRCCLQAKRHTQLKDSITRISNTIHAENERRRKQQAAKLTEQDIEKKELIAAGLNPYEASSLFLFCGLLVGLFSLACEVGMV